MPEDRPLKHPGIQAEVRRLIHQGCLYLGKHAEERMRQRAILSDEVKYILGNGRRVESRDEYDKDRQLWRYVVEGALPGTERLLRVVFAITVDPPAPTPLVYVITVVEVTT